MDVLQIIKQDHQAILAGLLKLGAEKTVKARRSAVKQLSEELLLHLHIEDAYVFPEVSGLFGDSDAFTALSLANHSLLRKDLNKLTKLVSLPLANQSGYAQLVNAIASRAEKHFKLEEELLLPQMRKLIRTQDREDLGLVILDVKSEGFVALPATSPQRRKRA